MRVSANGIEIEVDDRGPAGGEPLVLVMGLGMQLIAWPEEFVQQLVSRGHRVIRFDNRDIGLSQHFDQHGVPNVGWAALRYAMRLPVQAPYGLADLARDTLGVLDALGLQQVHLCGASMGGMVAQHVAAAQPSRVKSLTLMMTSSGSRRLPKPSLRVVRALMARPASSAPEHIVARIERVLRVIGSPGYPPPERLREFIHTMVARSWHPAGAARQMLAIGADGDRSAALGAIRAPTHIIHGDADPLVPVPAAHDLAAKICGATLDVIPGMGHDLPAALFERFADGIMANARRGGA